MNIKQHTTSRPIENRIYAAVVQITEGREHNGSYKGNGHHLAQEITQAVSIALLAPIKRKVYDALTDDWQTTKELSLKTGLAAKNISSILNQINSSTLLVHKIDKNNGKLKLWKR